MAVSMESIKSLRASTGAGIVDCRNALEACGGDVSAAADWLREKGIAKAAKKASRIAAEGLTQVSVCGNVAAVVEVNSETDFVAKNDQFQSVVKIIADAVCAAQPKTMEEANAIVVEGKTIETIVVDATATIGEKISFRRFEVLTKSDEESFGHYIHMGGKIAALTIVKGAEKSDLARDLAMHVAALTPTYVGIENVPADAVAHERKIQLEAAKNDPKLAGKPEAALEKILDGKVRKALSEVCLLEQEFVKEPGKKVSQVFTEAQSAVVTFIRYGVGEGMQKREENFADEVMAQVNK